MLQAAYVLLKLLFLSPAGLMPAWKKTSSSGRDKKPLALPQQLWELLESCVVTSGGSSKDLAKLAKEAVEVSKLVTSC